MNNRMLALTLVLLIQCAILPVAHGYSKDLNKTQSDFLINKKTNPKYNTNNKLNVSEKGYHPTSTFKPHKKGKIGRLTNRQHGIFTVLMPKTKLFIDVDYSNFTCKSTTIEMTPNIMTHVTSTAKSSKLEAVKFSSVRDKMKTPTPSFIEFYYLDLNDDNVERKHSNNVTSHKYKRDNKSIVGRFTIRKSSLPSLFKIHINKVPRKYSVMTCPGRKSDCKIENSRSINRTKQSKSEPKIVNNGPSTGNKKTKINNRQSLANKSENNTQANIFLTHKLTLTNKFGSRDPANMVKKRNITKPYKLENSLSFNLYPEEVATNFVTNSLVVSSYYSTANDKVKFFETYDSYTPKWQNYNKNHINNIINDYQDEEKFQADGHISLHGNEDTEKRQNQNGETNHVKKHIKILKSSEKQSIEETKITTYSSRYPKARLQNFHNNVTTSFPAAWSDFPFVAVYIYEPSRVRCDAAGISPHWLLAAASCLSRHHRELRGGILSAFVIFCSEDWRNPQMISYVKRTLIHPLFRPKDKLRRYLFNAGLIQVVNSLDSCNGWTPVNLMSHQFTADQNGAIGTAVGWGLDRYDDKRTVKDVRWQPLMKYEGLVYSQKCPGSIEYSNAKSSDEEGIRNVYCLSLPPYLAEENDTIHGALLLIGGKLLALYLQEERRPVGEQSAQYTSLWRLLPWLSETAQEPDDTFPFEI